MGGIRNIPASHSPAYVLSTKLLKIASLPSDAYSSVIPAGARSTALRAGYAKWRDLLLEAAREANRLEKLLSP